MVLTPIRRHTALDLTPMEILAIQTVPSVVSQLVSLRALSQSTVVSLSALFLWGKGLCVDSQILIKKSSVGERIMQVSTYQYPPPQKKTKKTKNNNNNNYENGD